MEKLCRDCRHWLKGRATTVAGLQYGDCAVIRRGNVSEGGAVYIYAAPHDDDPEFVTRDDFGCVLFEPKEAILQ